MPQIYQYRPEATGDGFSDYVTFIEPNEINIERRFDDGRISNCTTYLEAPLTGGNAWTTEDIQQVLAAKGIRHVLDSGGGTYRLIKTMDGEGSRKPFTLIWNGIQLNILPENTTEVVHPPANDDIVAMVYVLTKIYRQQVSNPQCKSLTDPNE